MGSRTLVKTSVSDNSLLPQSQIQFKTQDSKRKKKKKAKYINVAVLVEAQQNTVLWVINI